MGSRVGKAVKHTARTLLYHNWHFADRLLVCGAAQRDRFGYLANRVAYTLALFRSHLKIATALARFQDALLAHNAGIEDLFREKAEESLLLLREARPEEVISLFAARLGEREGDREPGEVGLLLSLNQKYLGSVRRMEGRVLRVLGRRRPVTTVASQRLTVRCGGALRPDPNAGWSSVSPAGPSAWSAEVDHVTAARGFSYRPAGPLQAQALTPEVGCWRADERIAVAVLVQYRPTNDSPHTPDAHAP